MDIHEKIQLKNLDVSKLLLNGFEKKKEGFYIFKKVDAFEFRLTLSEGLSQLIIFDLDFGEECITYGNPVILALMDSFIEEINRTCMIETPGDNTSVNQVKDFIKEHFGVTGDFPFSEDFESEVFRHPNTKKWFALLMKLSYSKFYPGKEGFVYAMNLKTDFVSKYTMQRGIFPAYHMNKKYWVTVLLDGTVPDASIYEIIEESYTHSQKK